MPLCRCQHEALQLQTVYSSLDYDSTLDNSVNGNGRGPLTGAGGSITQTAAASDCDGGDLTADRQTGPTSPDSNCSNHQL